MDRLLNDFISTLDASFKEHLSRAGGISNLTVSQTLYIEAIHELGQPTITELAEKLNITKASVTAGVNKLLSQGYVAKTQSREDKRVFHLSLTLLSEQLIQARTQILKEYGASVRAALSKDEAQQFEAIIAKLLKHFQT